MKWCAKAPAMGDMIRVGINSIYHYGIFASAEEIIQFGLTPFAHPTLPNEEIEVCISTLDEFVWMYFRGCCI